MAHIKPFQSFYYNIDKIGDVAKVISPPYDIISDEQLVYYHTLSPYNFTHIDLARSRSTDTKDNSRYTRAQKLFEEWQKKEILIQDEKPCVYIYKQDYTVMGQKYSRLGFIALMRLEDGDDSKVFPHENTHAHTVDDRFQLTKTLNANLSCIFVCYGDKQRKVESIFNKKIVQKTPLIHVKDSEGVDHRLWRLDDPLLIREINQSVEGQNLFIADGHHRYEVACAYRKLRSQRKSFTSDEPYDYVMTYFTNLDSRDLQIFPMHRIVKKFPKKLTFLEDYFRVDKMRSIDHMSIDLARAGLNEHAFGVYTKGEILLLRLKSKLMISEYVKEGSDDYKQLDATLLKSFIFDKVGIDSKDIVYTKDINEVIFMVDTGAAEAGFIMNPVKISQLKAIALNGERMPPKTTYFYPKVLSGLTIYKME